MRRSAAQRDPLPTWPAASQPSAVRPTPSRYAPTTSSPDRSRRRSASMRACPNRCRPRAHTPPSCTSKRSADVERPARARARGPLDLRDGPAARGHHLRRSRRPARLRGGHLGGDEEVTTKSGLMVGLGEPRRGRRRARHAPRVGRADHHRRPVPGPDRAPPARRALLTFPTGSRRSRRPATRSASTTSPPARSPSRGVRHCGTGRV
jgi:hypothetical protein